MSCRVTGPFGLKVVALLPLTMPLLLHQITAFVYHCPLISVKGFSSPSMLGLFSRFQITCVICARFTVPPGLNFPFPTPLMSPFSRQYSMAGFAQLSGMSVKSAVVSAFAGKHTASSRQATNTIDTNLFILTLPFLNFPTQKVRSRNSNHARKTHGSSCYHTTLICYKMRALRQSLHFYLNQVKMHT